MRGRLLCGIVDAGILLAVNVVPSSAPAICGLLCLVVLVTLLASAAISDVRRRQITNRICVAVSALALPYWLAVEPEYSRLLIQLGLALCVGILLVIPFVANLLGGGDVKLLTALTLWLPPASLPQALLIVSIAGGVLGLILLLSSRFLLEKPTVPYGVAIALAGIVQATQQIMMLPG